MRTCIRLGILLIFAVRPAIAADRSDDAPPLHDTSDEHPAFGVEVAFAALAEYGRPSWWDGYDPSAREILPNEMIMNAQTAIIDARARGVNVVLYEMYLPYLSRCARLSYARHMVALLERAVDLRRRDALPADMEKRRRLPIFDGSDYERMYFSVQVAVWNAAAAGDEDDALYLRFVRAGARLWSMSLP